MSRKVILQFSFEKLIIMLSVWAILLYFSVSLFFSHTSYPHGESIFLGGIGILVCVGLAVILFRLAFQIIFRGGRALYMDGDKIIYLSPNTFQASLSDIIKITYVKDRISGAFHSVKLTRSDERTILIRFAYLSGSVSDNIFKIKEIEFTTPAVVI